MRRTKKIRQKKRKTRTKRMKEKKRKKKVCGEVEEKEVLI